MLLDVLVPCHYKVEQDAYQYICRPSGLRLNENDQAIPDEDAQVVIWFRQKDRVQRDKLDVLFGHILPRMECPHQRHGIAWDVEQIGKNTVLARSSCFVFHENSPSLSL